MSASPEKPGAIIIEGHVQGLSNTRSLGEAGIPVYVIDKNNCIARYSKYCKKFFLSPPFDKDEFATFLIDLALKENINGWLLLPSNDHAVYTISKHKKQLEKYFKVITPGLDIIDNIYDKSRLLNIAQSNGIPIPKTQYFSSIKEQVNEIEFPVLTKGRFGLSFYKTLRQKAFLAGNYKELQSQLKEIEKIFSIDKTFTQELIPFNGSNKTISFTAFCVKGEIKTYWMGIKLREHPKKFGTATYCVSIFEKELIDRSKRLLIALKYEGICEIEYLKDPRDNEFKLIEINARTWLWVRLAAKCGVNFPVLAYNHMNGLENKYPEEYSLGHAWQNLITDYVYNLSGIFKNAILLKNKQKNANHKVYNAIWERKDPKPFLLYILMLPFFSLFR